MSRNHSKVEKNGHVDGWYLYVWYSSDLWTILTKSIFYFFTSKRKFDEIDDCHKVCCNDSLFNYESINQTFTSIAVTAFDTGIRVLKEEYYI